MPEAAAPPGAVLTVNPGEARDGAIPAEPGDTLLAALRRAGTGVRSICGGRCACGTCRIAVEPAWIGRLPQPSRNEARLLGVLPGAVPAHRLACQIALDEQTDGLAFRLDTPVRRPLAETEATEALERNP
jgi:ferredoxin-2, mitochondrial